MYTEACISELDQFANGWVLIKTGLHFFTLNILRIQVHGEISVMNNVEFSALYRDEESMASFYAGIVAETPNQRNAYR